jgi:hypothetical protein
LAKLVAALLAAALLASALLAGCGASIRPDAATVPYQVWSQARPIGHGPGFHLPASGPVVGPCRRRLGPRDGVHVEVFAENRVVLLPAAIGTEAPLSYSAGRIAAAGCYGDLVTLEPTGVVLVRRGSRPSLSDLFRSWGQRLSSSRVAAFPAPAGTSVAVFVDGRRWPGAPAGVRLSRHAEIVLEVGPHVPPHTSYTFPPGA